MSGLPATADADEGKKKADALLAEAAKLGQAGDLKGAIVKFKAADAVFPRALVACNIGLAYSRMKQWAQAQLFLGSCRERWNKDETRGLPGWVDTMSRDALAKLKAGGFVAVRFATTPEGATVSVSAFPSDETFTTPRVVWLPAGAHQVKATLAGYEAFEQKRNFDSSGAWKATLKPLAKPDKPDVKPDKPDVKPEVKPTPDPIVKQTRPRSHKLPWAITAAGVGLLAGGGIAHFFAMSAKSDAEKLPSGTAFTAAEKTFKSRRVVAIGMYAVGAISTVVGALLLRSSGKQPAESTTAIGATTSNGGGLVWVRWEH